jgi:hypothetical protein
MIRYKYQKLNLFKHNHFSNIVNMCHQAWPKGTFVSKYCGASSFGGVRGCSLLVTLTLYGQKKII